MTHLGDARPEAAPAPATAEDDDSDLLFARKGGAAPSPRSANRPAIYLVEADDSVSDDETPADNDAALAASDTARADSGVATLFAVDADEPAPDSDPTPAAQPAASLDAAPFDPSRRRSIAYDDAPPAGSADTAGNADEAGDTAETDDAIETPAPPLRPRLLTVSLAFAAVAAAIAAVITAVSWSQFAERPVPVEPAPAAPQAAVPVTTPPAQPAIPVAAPTPPPPVIDLVRVEPDGGTLIAGRGAPGTALIVLDNDQAIGNVVVGASGDWMLTPAQPLAGGSHEIALAIRSPEGTVSLATPHVASGASPKPRPTPATLADDGGFVVQIASVKTADGAAREWAKLKAGLPDLLGDLEPTIDTAELRDRGTFHRIRLGPFDDRDKAHALCSALNAAGRDCLVLRR